MKVGNDYNSPIIKTIHSSVKNECWCPCMVKNSNVIFPNKHISITGANYVSAFRPRRHYVFGLSVRPSVWSLKYPLLTCTWVRWSTRPTVTVLRHVCPSVCPERFPGICRRTHIGNGPKLYMLMCLDHLQNWSVYGHGLSIFLILALFWLCETGQIWGFRAFPGKCMEEMAWNFARWCILTTFICCI